MHGYIQVPYQSIFRNGADFSITYFIIKKYGKDISRKNFTSKINTEGRSKEVARIFEKLSLFRV